MNSHAKTSEAALVSLSHIQTEGKTEEMSEWKSMCEESMTFYALTGPLCGFMMTY